MSKIWLDDKRPAAERMRAIIERNHWKEVR